MTTTSLVLAITIGGAALALWTYSRFETLAPERIGVCLVHVCASLVLVNFVVPLLMRPIVGDGESIPHTLAALFAVFLPAIGYAFLSGIWALAQLRRALPSR